VDFAFSEDQGLLRDSLAAYLSDRYDFDSRRKAAAQAPGWRPGVWKAFAEELGILGAPFPEALGGLGGGAEANMIVMEALGEHLVLEPYLETVVLSGGLLERIGGEAAETLIGQIVSGEAVVVLAYAEPSSRYDLDAVHTAAWREEDGWRLDGHKAVVAAAPWATHLLVTARAEGEGGEFHGESLFLVAANGEGVSLRDYATMDGRRAAEVTLEDAPATLLGEEGGALPHLEAAVDAATAAACAEAVGLMRRMHRETVEYARQRRQFGRAIGEFQVIQHRLVDMFMAVEQAVSMTYLATLSLGEEPAARARAVSAAKARVGKSIREVGQGAVQIHGGIGMTDELALGWRFKRATAIEQLFGDTEYHLRRFERSGAGVPEPGAAAAAASAPTAAAAPTAATP